MFFEVLLYALTNFVVYLACLVLQVASMDPSSSAGNSPLTDSEKNDVNSRQTLDDEEPSSKKSQQQQGGNNRQQATPRKGPGVVSQQQQQQGGTGGGPSWRPTLPPNASGGSALPNHQQGNQGQNTHRFAGKPRLPQTGLGGGGPGMNQGSQGQSPNLPQVGALFLLINVII